MVFGVCAVFGVCMYGIYVCLCVLNSACVVYVFVMRMGFLWGVCVVYVCSVCLCNVWYLGGLCVYLCVCVLCICGIFVFLCYVFGVCFVVCGVWCIFSVCLFVVVCVYVNVFMWCFLVVFLF